MSSKSDDDELNTLLKRLATSSTSSPNLPLEEISLLAKSLTPSASRQSRSLAFLCLSKLCDTISHHPSSTLESTTSTIYSIFEPYIKSTFLPNPSESEESTEPESCIPLTYLLTSLFPLSPDASVKFLGINIEEMGGDVLGILLEIAELPSLLQPALAELLIAAAGTKIGRNLVKTRSMVWLNGAIDLENQDLSVLCAVVLSKMSREEDILEAKQVEGDNEEKNGLTNSDLGLNDEFLCRKLMIHVEETSTNSSSSSSSAILSTLEGLSILSLQPKNKIILTSSSKFLEKLIELSPNITPKGGSLPITPRGSMDISSSSLEVDTGLCFGLTTILVNLTNPKKVLSVEDEQIKKLRLMALSANKSKSKLRQRQDEEGGEEECDSEENVENRVQAIIKAGIFRNISGLNKTESKLVKENLGKLCLNLLNVQNKSNRLLFIKDGGFKVLSNVIKDLLNLSTSTTRKSNTNNQSSSPPIEVNILPSLQALAKMIITTPPNLLFPPPHITTSLNSLTPLYQLLIHPNSTLLQKFESLMAFTNLASIDQSISNKIITADVKPLIQDKSGWKGSGSKSEDTIRIIVKIEECLLDDNDLIRRASSQLICNLISSEKGFEYFSGESSNLKENESRVKSRLNILLILIGIDDLETKLASGGSLAIITESSKACNLILSSNSSDNITSNVGKKIKTTWDRILSLLNPIEEEEEYDENGEIIPVISSSPSLPNSELIHRGVIILFNLITYIMNLNEQGKKDGLKDIKDNGVEGKLMDILGLKGMSEEILVPTVEALKLLKKA